nr:PR domain zinc finger protein 5-like [Maniola hyperantus]
MHCLGHGNPDVECSTCRKVFASKSTLQNHIKIHLRKHKCPYCRKTYQKFKDLTAHLEKAHLVSKCDICNSTASTLGLEKHKEQHKFDVVLAQKPEPGAFNSERNLSVNNWPDSAEDYSVPYEETKQDHDSVIAQATSNELFLLHAKKGKKGKKCKEKSITEDYSIPYEESRQDHDAVIAQATGESFLLHAKKGKKCKTKRCNVCLKNFDRRSDLKRHLIEHILRSSLEKDPIDDSGILHLTCEVCQSQTFSRIDEYKAHLREHAKLTTYKCTVCGKTFSDSSNFSKHKKVHGNQHFQCDICLRKFNTKKTLIAHIEYHNANRPIKCYYCNKKYHFQSALNKHIKFVHEQIVPRYKCTICDDFLSTVKEKWEHEWLVHQVRKVVVDCLICGAKFRKYSELKRHCQLTHKVEIPPARRLLRKRDDRK